MIVKLNEQGLLPAIAQDANTGEVLMMGYMNPGSLKRTVEGVQVWFYSRSREDLWHKGEMSGNYLNLKEAYLDCDADTILLKVDPDGPACHTGEVSCFFNKLEGLPEEYEETESGPSVLGELFALIKDRQQEMPGGSYTASLFQEGVPRIAQKVVEEAGETAIAASIKDNENLPGEIADLLYHTLVLLAATGVQPEAVYEKLRERRK
ncbi:MAG: bifunctional phosphoribosyl-AMP cyclohydrolase/phosphoribosyl-ATP pyrophosphatase [Chloroflexi bacterium]|jgi:phosphoribosyl-ATP pyrophosphohydrolase/phosphoribosyl-AMP cyclohydrolase|nr:bifunctional phosphoribosyl-AMP cyclohydrolase/phosphoribosyl-ATP pyrophosphatase [Chloroflexota bacterium]MDP6498678.1 bifunctional phosphoribosyl-AMP cyclohydrolase/phosphoribosyl-ATP diphosphatase HisIE [Dehalococcoidia bacterium]MQF87919.1 bifunctional phosphoribosyl-AMP cyclohydrolase/phosphoribosyl-ATP diphosphatase HisIE [SAR202 cluster bacterium]MQG11484.1 bifunctional phosphoribosyl-AMP cyclohydrolase/phosphoribosyl-ATP diphosphatase HisIE [SAR202 cluster bacterium]MQG53932.1 bifunc|tara:strand:- start:2353 stop:2973 length:621 start_codon:yes stop_codon:yes gene_type:complete